MAAENSWILVLQQTNKQPFNGRLSGTTRVGRYQKKHSPGPTTVYFYVCFNSNVSLLWAFDLLE